MWKWNGIKPDDQNEDQQSIQKYNHLKNKIAKGYSFIHEILFYELTKKK